MWNGFIDTRKGFMKRLSNLENTNPHRSLRAKFRMETMNQILNFDIEATLIVTLWVYIYYVVYEISLQSTDVMDVSEKRIRHYSSKHQILLVGEGDFSFSVCLASAFGSATNITATSLDSEGT